MKEFKDKIISDEYGVRRMGWFDPTEDTIDGIPIQNVGEIDVSVLQELKMKGYFEYIEILEHTESAVNLERVENGVCSLLNGHLKGCWGNSVSDVEQVLGNVRNARIEDKKIFANIEVEEGTDKGREICAALKDGLSYPTSIGYGVNSGKLNLREDGKIEMRVNNWELCHLAIVPQGAANNTALSMREQGAYRNRIQDLSLKERRGKEMSDKTEAAGVKEVEEEKSSIEFLPTEQEKKRELSNSEASNRFKKFLDEPLISSKINKNETLKSKATECFSAVHSGEKTFQESVRSLQQAISEVDKQEALDYANSGGLFNQLSKKEQESYSLLRLIRAASTDKKVESIETEFSDYLGKKNGVEGSGYGKYYTSMHLLSRAPDTPENRLAQIQKERTSLTLGTAASVGDAVQQTVMSDLWTYPLRKMPVLDRLGATKYMGIKGKMRVPVQTADVAGSWIAEGSNVTEENITVAGRDLTPHRFSTLQSITRELLVADNVAIEEKVRSSLFYAINVGLDSAGLSGTGSSNQPTGIISTSGIGKIAASTNGNQPTFRDVVNAVKQVITEDVQFEEVKLAMSAVLFLKYMTVQSDKLAADAATQVRHLDFTADNYVMNDGMFRIKGIPGVATTQLGTRTQGTSTNGASYLIAGHWPDLHCATWDMIEITVDPYTLAAGAAVRIISHSFHDVAVARPKAFYLNDQLLHAI